MTTRIEKLAAEYGEPIESCDCFPSSHFADGYRRALADMQSMSPPLAWWDPDVSFQDLMAAVAKELEHG